MQAPRGAAADPVTRDELDQGAVALRHVPLHLQPCFGSLGGQRGDLPVAERLAGEVLALPMHPDLEVDAQRRVVGEIAGFFAGAASRHSGRADAGAARSASTASAGTAAGDHDARSAPSGSR